MTEVGEGSLIARDMGRSWTTHIGGGGSSGARSKARRKKEKTPKPTWASMEVPDWDGVPDKIALSSDSAQEKSDLEGKATEQKQPKRRSKKKRKSVSVGVSTVDAEPALTTAEPVRDKQSRKKTKGTNRKQDLREQAPVAKNRKRQQSANSAIFSIGDNPPERQLPSKKRRRELALTEEKQNKVTSRDAELKAAARALKQQQREQQRRAAAIAAAAELRPEEEQQLEKGAALLLRKLKGASKVKHLETTGDSNNASLEAQAKGSVSKDKSLHMQYKKKLSGARFRYLNEMLYTSKGADSFRQFQDDPELFDVYHSGFREQVEAWPVNPVDIILKRLARLEQRHSRHGRGNSARFAVADFGCGDAAIAQSMALCRSIVHSFDLVARNDWVTSADMAHVPLPDGAADAAVFSLSLMGVNYIDYIVEAHRVLAPGGRLLIAEVHSRIDDFDKFEKTISSVGFLKKAEDKSNKMFVLYEFERLTGRPLSDLDRQALNVAELKPCVYKRR